MKNTSPSKIIYADTSVLSSLTLSDSNSIRSLKMVKTVKPSLVFNSLLRLEVENSIRLSVAHQMINEREAQLSRNRIEQFEKNLQWVETNVDWERTFARALGLSKSHTSNIYSRSLDILHVACAMEIGCRHFWSFDRKQRSLAEMAGLRLNSLD